MFPLKNLARKGLKSILEETDLLIISCLYAFRDGLQPLGCEVGLLVYFTQEILNWK